MGNKRAVPTLVSVLSNLEEHPMVRHEAGEIDFLQLFEYVI
jgi:hypothetical protein